MNRRPVTAVAVLLSAVALSACGTSLHARTYQESGRTDGTSVDVQGRNSVNIRNLHVDSPLTGRVLPAGESAVVTGALVNSGSADDALVAASTPAATGAVLLVDGAEVTQVAIPAGGSAPTGWAVRLDGLTADVHVAQSITMTLEFQNAGRVTLRVPVYAGENGLQNRPAEEDPYSLEK